MLLTKPMVDDNDNGDGRDKLFTNCVEIFHETSLSPSTTSYALFDRVRALLSPSSLSLRRSKCFARDFSMQVRLCSKS